MGNILRIADDDPHVMQSGLSSSYFIINHSCRKSKEFVDENELGINTVL